jgi:hypothetical protein
MMYKENMQIKEFREPKLMTTKGKRSGIKANYNTLFP